jgi:secretion/DNA translocation related TadE-like protein
MSRARPSERGSASVVVAAILVAVMLLALGAADLARVLVAASRAQTAADAAALGAAQELALAGGSDPAGSAAALALRNGAELLTCSCAPGTLEARVEVRAPVGALLLGPDGLAVAARARAVVEVPAP